MKNKLKFIMATFASLSMTFFTYSCSSIQHNESEPDIKDEINKEDKEYDEAYKELWNIYTSLTSTFRSYIKEGVFMTPTSLKNINHMPYSVFNFDFFDLNDQRVLYRKYVQISNKEDFDDLIIKRYKELNNFNNTVASNEEIQKTFEKLYLNNQPIDCFLEKSHARY